MSATLTDCSGQTPHAVIEDDDDNDDGSTVHGDEEDGEYEDSIGDRNHNAQLFRSCPDWEQLSSTELPHTGKALWALYSEKLDQLRDVRKKRAVDRKKLDIERKKRRAAEKMLKQALQEIDIKTRQITDERTAHAQAKNNLEQDFLKARAAFSELMKKDFAAALDDGKIRQSLGEITTGLETWAKEWANETLPKGKSLLTYVETLMTVNGKTTTSTQHLTEAFANREKLASRIILLSQVSKLIFEEIFQNPFFLVDDLTFDSSALPYLFKSFQKVNMQKACLWKSETMQLWCSEMEDIRKTLPKEHSVRMKRFETFVDGLTIRAIQRADSFLNRSSTVDTERLSTELAELIHHAADLSLRLACQRNRIALSSTKIMTEPFMMPSELYKPHSSMGYDGSDTNILGKPIDAVIVPAIVAYGSAEGENYDEYKVWSKGIVLLYDDSTEHVAKINEMKSSAALSTVDLSHVMASKRAFHETSQDISSRKRQKSDECKNDVKNVYLIRGHHRQMTGAAANTESTYHQITSASTAYPIGFATTVHDGCYSSPSYWTFDHKDVSSSSQLTTLVEQVERGDTCDARELAKEKLGHRRTAGLITRALGIRQEGELKQISQELYTKNSIGILEASSLPSDEAMKPPRKVNSPDHTGSEAEFDPRTEKTPSSEQKIQKTGTGNLEAQATMAELPDPSVPKAGHFSKPQEELIRRKMSSDQDVPGTFQSGSQKRVIDLSDEDSQHIKSEGDESLDRVEKLFMKHE